MMKTRLINVLEQFCPGNVYLQGTLNSDDAYPESFCTFWTNYTEDNKHYDNNVTVVDWDFSVYFYSSDPLQVAVVPQQILTALKAVGFIPQGKGRDIPSDEPSHTGWVIDFIFRETIND